jgi:hypothetical protein
MSAEFDGPGVNAFAAGLGGERITEVTPKPPLNRTQVVFDLGFGLVLRPPPSPLAAGLASLEPSVADIPERDERTRYGRRGRKPVISNVI